MTRAVVIADLPGVGIVTDLIGGVSGWAFDQISSGIGHWVLDSIATLLAGLITSLNATTTASTTQTWFAGPGSPYDTVRAVAGVLLVMFTLLSILTSLVRGDTGSMIRQVTFAAPVAVIAMIACPRVVAQLVSIVDDLSATVLGGQQGAATKFLSGFGAAAAVASSGGFAAVAVGLLAVIAAVAMWAELVVRTALIFLLVALSPLLFAASVWPPCRHLLRRLAELLIAVIVAKLVIAVTLAVGAAALGGAGSTSGVEGQLATLLIGTVVIALGAFSPFIVLRLIPGADHAAAVHGISHSPLRAASSAAGTVLAVNSVAHLAGSASSTITGKLVSGSVDSLAGSRRG